MTDIPDDVFEDALNICLTRSQAILIAKLVLAERSRCAGIVEHMARNASLDHETFNALGVVGLGKVMAYAIGQGCERVRNSDENEQGQPDPLGLGDILTKVRKAVKEAHKRQAL